MRRSLGTTRLSRWGRLSAAIVAPLLVLSVAGCSMVGLQRDLSEAKSLGLVSGRVLTPDDSTEEVVVALFRRTDKSPVLERWDQLDALVHDYVFILEAKGAYTIAAFQDRNGNRTPDSGEPQGLLARVSVEPEGHVQDLNLQLSEATVLPADLRLSPSTLADTSLDSIPIAAGEVTSLDDERFSPEQASEGMWSPLTAVREVGGGIYFLEPYDSTRLPVLFVHGIGGSPRDFEFLIERLDSDRFQPWVFHYPSGVRLHRPGRLLAQLVASLHRELGLERLILTAHSMGGLVARAFLVQLEQSESAGLIDLFVTFSTPWGGHKAAAAGVKYAPAVVPSWLDVKPGSDFLAGLQADLPDGVKHHLFFGFQTRRKPLMLYSHDSVVSVASQLTPWAQERAVRTYGYDLDHVGILADEEVSRAFGRVLASTAD